MNAKRVKGKKAPPPPEELRLALQRNLPIYRRDRDMTQRQLAAAAEVSQRTVSEIESQAKNANLDTITALARALGIPPLDLLTPLKVARNI